MVRYVGGSNYDRDQGLVNGAAFARKNKDEDGLSFTERGILADTLHSDISRIWEILASRMAIGKTACLCEINVGRALEALEEFADTFEFHADPLEPEGEKLPNPAHALLIGLPFEGEAIGSLKSELAGDLLRQNVQGIYPVIS